VGGDGKPLGACGEVLGELLAGKEEGGVRRSLAGRAGPCRLSL
jgi:hypothetical protein